MQLAVRRRAMDARARSVSGCCCDAVGEAALEQAADDLLRSHGMLGRRAGIYTEAQFRRKLRIESRREPEVDETALPPALTEFELDRQLEELIWVSGLTRVQETVFRLWATGLSIQDLARTLNIRHQAVAVRLSQARRKVQAAYREGRYAGWYEVYLSEVRRSVYRPRPAAPPR